MKHGFKCHLCDNIYIEKDDLTEHLIKVHKVDKIATARFKCKLCNLEMKKMFEIRNLSSLNTSIKCTFCRRKYTKKNQLDAHMEENHMDQVMMTMGGGAQIVDEEVSIIISTYADDLLILGS